MNAAKGLSIRVGIQAARHVLATGSLANVYLRRPSPSSRNIYTDRRAFRAALRYIERHYAA